MLTLAAVIPWLFPSSASGWSNGTEGCNSFGTHDLVLDEALDMVAGEASWVMRRVALRATDDPDCEDGIDHASGSWWHVYDIWGDQWGGADEAAHVWFQRMERRLAAGNERGASKALGILAHIVADVAQPMHTDSSTREDRVHSNYEAAVDRRVGEYRFTYDGADGTSAGARARQLARNAHRYYWELVRAYDNHSYDDRVHVITRRQLNRAANALADLVNSL